MANVALLVRGLEVLTLATAGVAKLSPVWTEGQGATADHLAVGVVQRLGLPIRADFVLYAVAGLEIGLALIVAVAGRSRAVLVSLSLTLALFVGLHLTMLVAGRGSSTCGCLGPSLRVSNAATGMLSALLLLGSLFLLTQAGQGRNRPSPTRPTGGRA